MLGKIGKHRYGFLMQGGTKKIIVFWFLYHNCLLEHVKSNFAVKMPDKSSSRLLKLAAQAEQRIIGDVFQNCTQFIEICTR